MIRVYDGYQERNVPVSCCQSLGAGGYIDTALTLLHTSNHKTPKNKNWIDEIDDEHTEDMAPWGATDVASFCDGVRRFGDNIRKVVIVCFFFMLIPFCTVLVYGRYFYSSFVVIVFK
jgi:hypothetical protein